MRKITALLTIAYGSLLAFSIHSLYSENGEQNNKEYVPWHRENCPNRPGPYGDCWYGPGYYYGNWYDNEDDYWGWRGDHQEYPPNREYYNHDHPVEYHPEREGGQMREDRNEGEREGRAGGDRGGGRGRR